MFVDYLVYNTNNVTTNIIPIMNEIITEIMTASIAIIIAFPHPQSKKCLTNNKYTTKVTIAPTMP